MKILLLGKNGQLGWELQRSLVPIGELVALGRDDSPLAANFANPEALVASVREIRPQVIVNAAAYTAVDKAETELELARKVNAVAPGALAREAAALGAWLVHYSTDYVFDGTGEIAWTEEAPTAPLNVYGKTKLEGEGLIRASGCRHMIFRTSWVYSARGGNFAKTMLRLARERDRLTVIDDQFGAPTGADLLADVTAHAMRVAQVRPDVSGTYHAVADGETTWHGYARFVVEWARDHGVPIKVAPEAIERISTNAFPTPAKRPCNSRLNTAHLRETFDLTLPHWRTGVERMLVEVHDR